MYDLNTVDTQSLIDKIRNGVPLTLVCKQAHEGFSASVAYPVQKVSLGCALEVLDDDGEAILLDDDYPALELFSVVESSGDVDRLQQDMKEQSLGPLLELSGKFLAEKSFKINDVVRWIPGLQIMNMPAIDQPAVVLEKLDEPVFDEGAELGDPSSSIRCDMVIGFMVDSQRMITVLADSRRFEFHYQDDDRSLSG